MGGAATHYLFFADVHFPFNTYNISSMDFIGLQKTRKRQEPLRNQGLLYLPVRYRT